MYTLEIVQFVKFWKYKKICKIRHTVNRELNRHQILDTIAGLQSLFRYIKWRIALMSCG